MRTVADAIQTARSAKRAALAHGFQSQASQIVPKQMLMTAISATVSTTAFAESLCPLLHGVLLRTRSKDEADRKLGQISPWLESTILANLGFAVKLTQFWNEPIMPAFRKEIHIRGSEMSVTPSSIAGQMNQGRQSPPPTKLLTVRELCEVFRVTPGWAARREPKERPLILCLLRFGAVGFASIRTRFPPIYESHERHRPGATLDSPDGSAPIQRKGACTIEKQASSDRQYPVA